MPDSTLCGQGDWLTPLPSVISSPAQASIQHRQPAIITAMRLPTRQHFVADSRRGFCHSAAGHGRLHQRASSEPRRRFGSSCLRTAADRCNSPVNNTDPTGLSRRPGKRVPPIAWPDPGPGWVWDKSEGAFKKGGRYRDWDTTPNHRPHWNESDKNGNRHINVYVAGAAWGAVAVGAAWVLWDIGKWTVAIATAPETGGGSIGVACATP
jgi:hypothetical protein